jgi:urease alpha subunit
MLYVCFEIQTIKKMKKHFDELFTNQNGMVNPKVTVHINGVTLSPGVSSGVGVSYGGVDLTQFIGKYLEVELQNGVCVIRGVYN